MPESVPVMTAAVVRQPGEPVPGEFPVPVAVGEGHVVVEVLAAPVTGLDRAIAGGAHPLSPETYPVVAGREGVGRTADGRLVYFDRTVRPHGSMAQRALVPADCLIDLPDGTEPARAATLGNAGLAAWLPLSWRARLEPGEAVAVLGAGGVVGSLALQVARHLGAGPIIAVVQGAGAVERARDRGADFAVDTTGIADEDLAARLRETGPGFDVILDYLWGPSAVAALACANPGARLVQIGTVHSDTAVLSGGLLRAKGADVLGFTIGHAPDGIRRDAYRALVALAGRGELRVPVAPYPIDDFAGAWSHVPGDGEPTRPVLLPQAGSPHPEV